MPSIPFEYIGAGAFILFLSMAVFCAGASVKLVGSGTDNKDCWQWMIVAMFGSIIMAFIIAITLFVNINEDKKRVHGLQQQTLNSINALNAKEKKDEKRLQALTKLLEEIKEGE